MSGQTLKTTALAALVLGLAACQAGDETAPETAAALPETAPPTTNDPSQ